MKRPLPATVVALAVFVLAGVGLTLHRRPVRPPVPAAVAVRAALGNSTVHKLLGGARWTRADAQPVDGTADRVTFYAGSRVVLEAQVRRDGTVSHEVNFRALAIPYGNSLAYEPATLIGLAALFMLMGGVLPLRRLRNLDLAAALSLLVPVVILRARYVEASVVAAAPGLIYLLARSAWQGLAPARVSAPATPVWQVLAGRLEIGLRLRVLRLLLLALALVYGMVAVSSTSPVDVIYAVMEGATQLVHGVLPYGHMPGDVVHGDTYPLLSYALYAPVALLAPVRSIWDSVDLALAVGVLAVLAAAAGVCLAGRPLGGRPPGVREAGLRAALTWLSFPPLLITASTGTTDTVLAAMVLIAVLLWQRPAAATAMLTAAAWFKLAPAALLALAMAPLRGRRLVAAVAAAVVVSLPLAGLLVVLGGGWAGVMAMVRAVAFQFSRGSPQSLWSALGLTAWQPLGQAAVLALVAAAAVRLGREPALSADHRRVAALAAAVLIGLQLVADYWAFLYLAWVVPLLCLSLLQPDSVAVTETAGRPLEPLRLRTHPARA